MSQSLGVKPLSSYLKKLVEQGSLPGYVAAIFNRLPDWKQQREAVEDWQERLDSPAREIVAEFEAMKVGDRERYPLDGYLDGAQIVIAFGYHYLDETLDDYIDGTRSALERLLKESPCPFCGQPLMGDLRHVNCQTLWKYRQDLDWVRDLIRNGKATKEQEQDLKKYEMVVNAFEQACKTGAFADGVPWAKGRDPDKLGTS